VAKETSESLNNEDLVSSGGDDPIAIAFNALRQRMFTANFFSNSVPIIELPTVAKI
jgi:hypothetical protein